MKKMIYVTILLLSLFAKAEIKIISISEKIKGNFFKFAFTHTSDQKGPDINELIKENRKFFCKSIKYRIVGSKRLIEYRWYTFENNQDADALQVDCFNFGKTPAAIHAGAAMDLEWYYLDSSDDEKKQ